MAWGSAAWFPTGKAAAAPVRVVVHLPQQSGPPSTAGYVCMENGVLPVVPPRRDPRRDALLLIEPVEPTSAAAKPTAATAKKAPTVRILGMRFQPEIVASSDGTPVVFRNDDRLPVTLVSSEAPRLFPSTPLQPGATLSVAVPAGMNSLSVRVVEHPQMHATLLVPKGPWRHLRWSAGGDMGVAELDLPGGVYVARVFFAHHYVASQALSVPTDEATDASGKPSGKPSAKPAGAPVDATEVVLNVASEKGAEAGPAAAPDMPSTDERPPTSSSALAPAPAGSVE